MQTPRVKERDEFESEWNALRATGRCPRCRERFTRSKEVYLSRHAIEFGVRCTGQGAVLRVVLPWCARCEREPATYGCVHEPMFAGTRKRDVKPRRCDFCMEPNVKIEKECRAASFIEQRIPDGAHIVDAGIWAACRSCAALIEAEQYAALIEVAIRGTMMMHPEWPPQVEPLLRAKVRGLLLAVFGKIDFDGPVGN